MQYQGTLKFMHPTRGYGFIGSDAGVDQFVHKVDLERSQINTELAERRRDAVCLQPEARRPQQ